MSAADSKERTGRLESLVWLARTAIQLDQFGKAQSALDQVTNEKKLPKKFDHGEFSAVQAELALKRGKVDDAIVHLEAAVPNATAQEGPCALGLRLGAVVPDEGAGGERHPPVRRGGQDEPAL